MNIKEYLKSKMPLIIFMTVIIIFVVIARVNSIMPTLEPPVPSIDKNGNLVFENTREHIYIIIYVVAVFTIGFIIRILLIKKSSADETKDFVINQIKEEVFYPYFVRNYGYEIQINDNSVLKNEIWGDTSLCFVKNNIFIKKTSHNLSVFEIKELKRENDEMVCAFDGLTFCIDLSKTEISDVEINIITNNSFFECKDLKKINLESTEFENFFDVYATDQIKARMILTPYIMEKIVEFRKRYIDENITFKVINKRIYGFIDKYRIIDDERLMENGVSKEEVYYNLVKFNNFMESIIDVFEDL